MRYGESAEVRGHKESFIDRLRQLGATDSELDDIAHAWDGDDVTDAERDLLRIKSDGALVELLRAARSGEDADAAFAASEAPADPDVQRRAEADAQAAWEFDAGDDFNLDQLASWVGDDRARAVVAHRAELARVDGGRKGAAELFDRFTE